MNVMSMLRRIFARTPSLRTRVVFATAIGTAIVTVIIGAIVWVGITNDRKYWLDRRLDEAAGLTVPLIGLGELPRSAGAGDAVITLRRANEVTSNSSVVLPELEPGYADTEINGELYRVRTVDIPGPGPRSLAVGATYEATLADTSNLHRRVILLCTLAIGAAAVLGWLLAAFAVRPLRRLAEQAARSMPATNARISRCAAPPRRWRSPRRCAACCSGSGPSGTAPRRRWPPRATSPRSPRMSCEPR